ncbi:MAG: hypothetical protein OEV91_02470 [Desulfobulbaceae bacterium]|nr:hypothetical protein [Desulfobulbaceae bacterium]
MTQKSAITDEDGSITHLEGENGVFYMTEEEKKRREARKEAWIDANRDEWFANGARDSSHGGFEVRAGQHISR